MAAAAGSVGQVGVATAALDFELDATASNVPYCGEQISNAMKRGAESTRGMSEEARVTEEMLGVRLPRGVNRLIGELPGLSTAITAAFSVSVVYFLVEALMKASEKLSGFIANTFIFTDAMKTSDAAGAKFNAQLVAISDATKKVDAELSVFGMTTMQKTSQALEVSSKLFNDNAREISANRISAQGLSEEQKTLGARVNELSGGVANIMLHWISWGSAIDKNTGLLVDNRAAIENLDGAYKVLSKQNEELTKEMALLNLQLRDEEDAARKQSLEKQRSYNQARIAGEQIIGSAMLALQKAQAEAEVATTDESGSKRLLIGVAYGNASYQLELAGREKKRALAVQSENELYQLEVGNLQNRATVEKTLGAVGIAAAAATQVQIQELTKSHHLKLKTDDATFGAETEALETKHSAKLIQTYADMMRDVAAIHKRGIETISSDATWSPLEKQAIKAATDIEKAFATLGITPTEQLKKALTAAGDAYTTLSKTGVASSHDLAKANLAVLQTQLELDKALGKTDSVKADQKAIDDLTKSLQKFEGETQKSEKLWDLFTADFKKKAKDTGTASQQMAKVLGDGASQMQKAFESAMEAAILSEKSFGEALKEATAQVLAQISAQAAVKALYELAMALASLAVGDFGGAGKHAAAAAEFGAVSAAAGVGAHAMAAGGGGSANPSAPGAIIPQNASTQTASRPVTTINAPHLGDGGLITHQTLAVVGDAPGGGDQTEAVIPLNDSAIARFFSHAFGTQLGQGTQNHYYLPGFRFSTADTTKLARQLTRGAQTGRVRITTTNSSRLTRRA